MKLQQAVIEFESRQPYESTFSLKDKAKCMLAYNQLRTQHSRWVSLTFQVHDESLGGVQVLGSMVGNVVAMSDADSLAMYEEGLGHEQED